VLTAEPSCKDEARVGHKGTHAYIWAPIGSRPLMVRDNRHDSAYIFGVIYPARAVGAAVLMPTANTEAMNEHLKEISTQVSAGAHAVLVCDGAGWHQRGKELVVPDNISLLPSPPYSPELNPMENVWDYLRQKELCAEVWDTYDDILEACKTAWNCDIMEQPPPELAVFLSYQCVIVGRRRMQVTSLQVIEVAA
jgi:hypothetical protein